MKISKDSIFWVVSSLILVLLFGQQFKDFEAAFYFTCLFLPVTVAVSYVFSRVLVPQYLLVQKYFLFGLYTLYTLIISLNLITIILVLSFALLANYRNDEMLPGSRDVLGLVIIMFFIALIKAFWGLIKTKSEQERILSSLLEKEKLNQEEFLIVVSNRKKRKIRLDSITHIESLGDYVKIIQDDNDPVFTKEKISHLNDRISSSFQRVHRSFIINTVKLKDFSADSVTIADTEIPIGRKYKSTFKEFLDSTP